LLVELWAGGAENFELDHFRPKARFPELEHDFYNLYWSCRVCNRNKWQHWPPEQLLHRGTGFVNLCQDDHQVHFRLRPDGRLDTLTESAQYTSDIVGLNRDHLVQLRETLIQLGQLCVPDFLTTISDTATS